MTDFIEGENRYQSTLFPERLDDYVKEDSMVRVVDVFVDKLDVSGLGFREAPNQTGRPPYNPKTLLKIYIYGYLNRVQSSRRLEREALRNVELMWLTGRLAPDFKTIANFRKDNGEAIRLVCREFVMLCKKLDLFADAFVAIDGSKFKAVNARDRNFTKGKIKRRLEQIDESIERYMGQIVSADRQESKVAKDKTERLSGRVDKLKEEMERLKKLEVRMLELPDQQISLTDPDARSMATSGRGSGMVGYNVQTAVDVKHHLIAAHEVTNQGHDRHQLANMAKGQYGKRDFIYKVDDDEYECPAGERLQRRTETHPDGMTVYRYWSLNCQTCILKSKCTTGKERRVSRWEHEAVLEQVEVRIDQEPERMKARRETVEHPFGTIKYWMGHTHFQTRTLERVSTEMSLHVLAYNMKRLISILGVIPLIEAIQA
jgi:transposase